MLQFLIAIAAAAEARNFPADSSADDAAAVADRARAAADRALELSNELFSVESR